MAAAAASLISSSLLRQMSAHHIHGLRAAGTVSPARSRTIFGTSFATGSPLFEKPLYQMRNAAYKYKAISIRCEQNRKQGNGLDAWLGRLAMVGFAALIIVETRTGKGLLENIGLISPLPTLVLTFTAIVGLLTAIFIFQSGSEN